MSVGMLVVLWGCSVKAVCWAKFRCQQAHNDRGYILMLTFANINVLKHVFLNWQFRRHQIYYFCNLSKKCRHFACKWKCEPKVTDSFSVEFLYNTWWQFMHHLLRRVSLKPLWHCSPARWCGKKKLLLHPVVITDRTMSSQLLMSLSMGHCY